MSDVFSSTQGISAEEELMLVRQAQDGDERAFATLVRHAERRMWSVCWSITGSKHDAEDAMQNALTAIWKHLDRFEPRARFSTWAYRIAANAALQIVRGRKEIVDAEAGENEVAAHSPVASQVSAALVVRDALAQLPEEFREVIVLREYAGLSYAEIAEHQKIGIQTVKSRINRARAKLKAQLEKAGITSAD